MVNPTQRCAPAAARAAVAACSAATLVFRRVLVPAVWDDGHEPSALRGDVTHRLARAQFGVGDVEEVVATGQGGQFVPGRDVGEV